MDGEKELKELKEGKKDKDYEYSFPILSPYFDDNDNAAAEWPDRFRTLEEAELEEAEED